MDNTETLNNKIFSLLKQKEELLEKLKQFEEERMSILSCVKNLTNN